jgi:hypothetical protein
MEIIKDLYRTTSPWFIVQLVLAELAGFAMLSLGLTWFIVYRSGFGEWTNKDAVESYHGLFMITGLIYIYGHGKV